ncbi:hypothetical protein AB0J80_05820 [Actinoplanes sp. NPDC049548]|uniref:hypothetical protein n=1 Tax=Actinoplanes sp. NPDC049548 TaxID=3155152 RepID=UPI00344011AF
MWAWRRRWVAPVRTGSRSDDRPVGHDGAELSGVPAVVAALAEAPSTFLALADDPADAERAIDRDDLPGYLGVTTTDGRKWELILADEVKGIIDTGGYTDVTDDLLEQVLALQPGVVSTAHLDREVYFLHLADPESPERVLARFINAVVQAHRELGRRLGVELPD